MYIQQSAAAQPIKHANIVIMGAKNVGKHNLFCKLTHLPCSANQNNVKSPFEKSTIILNTTVGVVELTIKVIPEQIDAYPNISDQLIDNQIAIIMFALDSRQSYKLVPYYYKQMVRHNECSTIILAGNKADLKQKKIKMKQIVFHRKKNLQFYNLSVNYNYNLHRMMTYALRHRYQQSQLEIISQQYIGKVQWPQTITNLQLQIKQFNDNWSELPQEDDDDL